MRSSIRLSRFSSCTSFHARVLHSIVPFLLAFAVQAVVVDRANSQPTGVEVRARRVSLIPPGTAIDKSPPTNWSHLIVKSHPRICDADVAKAGDMTSKLSSIIFTAFVANVKLDPKNPKAYRIDRIAVGIGTNIDGTDVVISPDTQKKQGAKFGLLARQVVSRTYEHQHDNIIVARTDTAAVVDAPVVMRRGQRNRFITFRYLLLADPTTGSLDALLWLVDLDDRGETIGAVGDIECLPANKIVDAQLSVDDSQYTLGIPSDLAFGVMKLPTGKFQIAMPEDLRPLMGKARFTAEEMPALETRMRAILKSETPRKNS